MTAPVLAVLGLWHLGAVSTGAWLTVGRSVRAWDPDPQLRDGLRRGEIPVVEPGLVEALTVAEVGDRLVVCDDAASALQGTTAGFIAFDSATDQSGRVADPRLDAAVAAVLNHSAEGFVLVVSSQVEVGTMDGWRDAALAAGRDDVWFVHVPENLRLGHGLDDYLRPARLVIGAPDEATRRRALDVLEPIDGERCHLDLAAAELAKHATNAYLGMCIAFANEMAWLARSAGADGAAVLEALRSDARVAPSAPLHPGSAFSGATLRRDLRALQEYGATCGRPDLFSAILDVNDRHGSFAVDLLKERLPTLSGARIAAIGLAYKPGTSTLRDSLPLTIVRRLCAEGASVSAYDPLADAVPEPPDGLTRSASLAGAVADADAVVTLSPLNELRDGAWLTHVPAATVVVDGCGVVDPQMALDAGLTFASLGDRGVV